MSEAFALGGGKWHIRGTGVWFPRIIANMAGKHPKSVFYLPISPNNYYAHHFDWSLPNPSFSNLQFHRFPKPSFSRVLLSYPLENFSYCLNKIFLSAGSRSWQFSQSHWAWTICFLPLHRYHFKKKSSLQIPFHFKTTIVGFFCLFFFGSKLSVSSPFPLEPCFTVLWSLLLLLSSGLWLVLCRS